MKRKPCPNCGRDTWSEKWKTCGSCGYSEGGGPPFSQANLAKARADAAGDKRQEKRKARIKGATEKEILAAPPGFELAGSGTDSSEGDAGDKRQEKRDNRLINVVPSKSFTPSAEKGWTMHYSDAAVPVGKDITAEGYAKLEELPKPSPGEKCPTCNRKVPKRRKDD